MTLKRMAASVVGAGLVTALILWIGPATLWAQVRALRWVLPLLVGLGFVKHALRARAWQKALSADGVAIAFWRLLKIRVASQAVAYVSSLQALVSEPLKPWLLRDTATMDTTIPATVVEASAYWMTSLLITTLGTFVAVNLVTDRHSAAILAAVFLIAFGVFVALLAARAPVVPKVATHLNRRRPLSSRWVARLAKAGAMEAQMRSFRVRHPGTVVGMVGLDVAVQAVMFTEVWLVLSAVGVRITIFQLLAIEAASRMVKMVAFSMPARVGADEAGGAGSFLLLGLDPAAGLTLALARRVQALCWTALGLWWLGSHDILRRSRRVWEWLHHHGGSEPSAAVTTTHD